MAKITNTTDKPYRIWDDEAKPPRVVVIGPGQTVDVAAAIASELDNVPGFTVETTRAAKAEDKATKPRAVRRGSSKKAKGDA